MCGTCLTGFKRILFKKIWNFMCSMTNSVVVQYTKKNMAFLSVTWHKIICPLGVVKNVLNYVKLKPVKSTETRICQNFSLLQKAKQKFTGHTCLLERSNNSWHKCNKVVTQKVLLKLLHQTNFLIFFKILSHLRQTHTLF